MNATRKIIEIDEELCNGCGQCVTGCAEGALRIVDGKAKLVADRYCDGLGACIGECPTGALTIIERPGEAFDEAAVHEMLAAKKAAPMARGCPSTTVMSLSPCETANIPTALAGSHGTTGPAPARESALSHWPIQLRLIPPEAPFLRGASLLLAADCVPAAFPGYHDFLAGRVVAIGCPKFDDAKDYVARLAAMIRVSGISDITVLEMEVPCCSGMHRLATAAAADAGMNLPIRRIVVSRRGGIMARELVGGGARPRGACACMG
ncbi:ATP-binding protein [Desulfolutivibrio sulfoxidireducens]|uniref:ATP-binding protein n=1 Tax=Desulfolutivibrio sulfoxidireducens TaxID=2773299 RepID=UPI00159E4282|nr:4Fe-4S binding protein [Desulfolutivibrio sulfoxidireducens]QLA17607.1 4Fe-4S dicluster domain-containing protein [Desulfolutivibrio sulfoxidireducens]QLA21183.1 4Fe-4S dicluster domain-containing protein [Desulfolutivibrio sulfoxidireducens]